jgi:hypothetical protein
VLEALTHVFDSHSSQEANSQATGSEPHQPTVADMCQVIDAISDTPASRSDSRSLTPNVSQAVEDSHDSPEPTGNTSPKPTEADQRKSLKKLMKEQERAQEALAAAEATLRALAEPGPVLVLVLPGESLEKAREKRTSRTQNWRKKEREDATAAADEATAKLAHLAAAIEKITTELKQRTEERRVAFPMTLRPRGVPGSSSAHASM